MSVQIRRLRKVNAPESKTAIGSFTTGAGAVNPTVNYGLKSGCASILRTGVGTYEITFDEAAKVYIFDYTVIWTTAAQSVIVATAPTPTTTKKVVLTIVGAGGNTAADVTGLRVDFSCEQFTDAVQ